MKTLISFIVVLISGILVGWIISTKFTTQSDLIETKTDTVFVEKKTLVPDYNLVDSLTEVIDSLLVESSKIVYKTVFDTINDTIVSVKYLVLPITQLCYDFPDTAKIYVSGYEAKLDSIHLFIQNKIVYKTIEKKQKKWNIGLTAGYGMTLQTQPELRPYVGLGITYSLISF